MGTGLTNLTPYRTAWVKARLAVACVPLPAATTVKCTCAVRHRRHSPARRARGATHEQHERARGAARRDWRAPVDARHHAVAHTAHRHAIARVALDGGASARPHRLHAHLTLRCVPLGVSFRLAFFFFFFDGATAVWLVAGHAASSLASWLVAGHAASSLACARVFALSVWVSVMQLRWTRTQWLSGIYILLGQVLLGQVTDKFYNITDKFYDRQTENYPTQSLSTSFLGPPE